MEINEEKTIVKAKKISIWILMGYLVCILAIIASILVAKYRTEKETPEPIDFTTEGAIGMLPEQYAYLKIESLTEEIAIYGNIENENNSQNERYYIAMSGRYMYIVDLDFDTIEQLKPLQEYMYSQQENAVIPEPITVYGMTESIPSELKKLVLDFYNKSVGEQYAIAEEDFELYFGSVLLNVRKTSPVDTSIEEMIIIISIIALIIIIITNIVSVIISRKTKKYLKKINKGDAYEK